MVGHAAAVPGRLEHQPELVADPRLTLELGQACVGRSADSAARSSGSASERTSAASSSSLS